MKDHSLEWFYELDFRPNRVLWSILDEMVNRMGGGKDPYAPVWQTGHYLMAPLRSGGLVCLAADGFISILDNKDLTVDSLTAYLLG